MPKVGIDSRDAAASAHLHVYPAPKQTARTRMVSS